MTPNLQPNQTKHFCSATLERLFSDWNVGSLIAGVNRVKVSLGNTESKRLDKNSFYRIQIMNTIKKCSMYRYISTKIITQIILKNSEFFVTCMKKTEVKIPQKAFTGKTLKPFSVFS